MLIGGRPPAADDEQIEVTVRPQTAKDSRSVQVRSLEIVAEDGADSLEGRRHLVIHGRVQLDGE
jgi:hypothetical protein